MMGGFESGVRFTKGLGALSYILCTEKGATKLLVKLSPDHMLARAVAQ